MVLSSTSVDFGSSKSCTRTSSSNSVWIIRCVSTGSVSRAGNGSTNIQGLHTLYLRERACGRRRWCHGAVVVGASMLKVTGNNRCYLVLYRK